MHWMNDRQFADMFAIAQVTPGPNVIVVTLIGYHVAGLLGAVVATLAMCGPTCVFAFFIGQVWDRFKDAPWRMAIQAALVPISIGLIGASAAVIARAAAQSRLAVAVTVLTAVVPYTGQPVVDIRRRRPARPGRIDLRPVLPGLAGR
jgi:chromate transporter